MVAWYYFFSMDDVAVWLLREVEKHSMSGDKFLFMNAEEARRITLANPPRLADEMGKIGGLICRAAEDGRRAVDFFPREELRLEIATALQKYGYEVRPEHAGWIQVSW